MGQKTIFNEYEYTDYILHIGARFFRIRVKSNLLEAGVWDWRNV